MATVMVIDDSKTVRSYHLSILKSLGFEALEAENGMEALEKCLDNSVDLFLVDVNMPIMDGYTFIQELRAKEGYELTPIIMITTQADEVDTTEAYKVGANLFETKPIKPDKLESYLKILL